jgi:hypothetical protein
MNVNDIWPIGQLSLTLKIAKNIEIGDVAFIFMQNKKRYL